MLLRDFSNNDEIFVFTAATCQNSPRSCNSTTQKCQDHGTGIKCICADGYVRNSNNECVAATCQNSPRSCNSTTEKCQDHGTVIKCICADGYVRNSNNECVEMKLNDSTTDTPRHVTRCPADVISIGGIALSFPSAEIGEKVDSDQTCSQQLSENQTHPLATRVCNQVWQEPELQNCFDVDTPEEQLDVILELNLTEVTVDQIANSLSLLTYQNDNISTHVLDVTVESLARIVEVGSPSLEVTDAVVGIVNSIMQINETVLDESDEVASVIPLMERQITNIQRNKQNYSQILQNLNISAIKLQKSAFEGDFNFVDHATNVNGLRDKESVQQTSITLPYSVIEVVNELYPKETTVPVTFVTYRDSILFRENDNDRSDKRNATNEYIASYVISSTVELPNITISGLPQNSSVIVSFSNMMLYEKGNDAKTEVFCVYWEYTSENGEGKWSQTGCRTLSSGLKDVTCSCDHLTSFAVLVRTYDEEETGFHLVLQLITIIGCIISIVGLFLSLLCMIIIRKVRSKQQTHVHLNLCFALLGLYLSFLFGVGQADQPEMCRAMTSVIYFFCLSSMAWMSVEAFYIYKLI
ncbi:Adhesion G protein-coupled receptor L3 [Holothuria leucospilota]|uniref:Adhesion G protein-coupled receptor L3 n=1 Tax=Holothuria leucospilota TaxID=206669 RepID=A0A9Q1CE69_HOLLE|nr:Adhesion G protein-coupled receptor L3 [Holothuria leucospilota]